ncbi:MAG: hypothetical protein IT308_06085 [Anaerolineaceae bacterium]|nr:hypothetical protein [Anaerolineaceae bacterium]
MFTQSDLRELLEINYTEPVLSLYLNTEPSKGNADVYKLRLRNLLKNASTAEDKTAVETYFNHEYSWAGRSVALFSCAARGFFRVFPLALPVRDSITLSEQPNLHPLVNLLENYGGYAVILIDKQGTRLFHFHLGELLEQEGWIGEPIKHTKRGGASSMRGRRGGSAGSTDYVSEMVERNIRDITHFAADFFEKKHIRRILLGGAEENIALLRTALPKAWQSLVVGTFPMSMTASHAEVLEHALEVGTRAERERESRLIEELITKSAKGEAAVTGLEGTLNAAVDGRVQTLFSVEDYESSGYQCQSCSKLFLKESKLCPVCGGKVEAIPNMVQVVINRVLLQKGNIEIVQPTPMLEKEGSIGAFLRY